MMPLFIYVYDIMGQVSEKIPVSDNACKSNALQKLAEMNARAEKEHTLFAVTVKDENGIDRWKEVVA